ncbi:hypothetical protein HDV01_000093 [Terramyces sp. JEL0728]|nr:hypothetical protein HDV01_000093 [Terramyces sp. JEL0728]
MTMKRLSFVISSIVMITSGTLSSFSIMSDGLRARYGWSLSDVNVIGSAGLAALYVTYMIIGPLFDKYGVTITMYTAIFTGTASYLFIWLSYLGLYNAGVAGMSILFFIVDGLGNFFLFLTVLNFVVYVLGALFIKRFQYKKVAPAVADEVPLTTTPNQPTSTTETTQLLGHQETFMTPLQILTSAKFWIYETLMILSQGQTFMQNVNIVIRTTMGQNADPNDLIMFTTLQLTIVSVLQSIGRIGSGTISDFLVSRGIDRSLLLLIAQGFTFAGHLLLVVADSSLLSSQYYLSLCSALIGLGFGGNGALFPLLTRGMFGAKYYGTACSYVMIGVPLGFISSNLIFGYVYDIELSSQAASGGHTDYCYGKQCMQTSFIIAVALQFISFALAGLLYFILQKRSR